MSWLSPGAMSGGHWGGISPVSVPLTVPETGEPLGDLDGWDSGRIEAARLEELRREAEELYLDAALSPPLRLEVQSAGQVWR